MLAAAMTQGFEKAAGVSTPCVTVTVGDQNLCVAEIREAPLSRSVVLHNYDMHACEGFNNNASEMILKETVIQNNTQ